MAALEARQGRVLLALARDAIGQALGHAGTATLRPEDAVWLDAPGASFVTLTQDGALRGCIGSLEARRALRDDVIANAHAAAFGDPRFAPLTVDELPRTRVEVSVLSTPERLAWQEEADALASLRPGIDGVILQCGRHRATFLPQVWAQLPDPRQFMEQLKRKAGLDADFWSPELRLARYTVQKFQEDTP